MCIVCYKSLITGFIGHGEPMACGIANEWLKSLSTMPDIIHWIKYVV